MTYAKIIDGNLIFAPRKMNTEIGGVLYTVFNPPAELLLSGGYLLVVYTNPTDDAPDGYHYEPTYTEANGEIVQGWELVKDPDDIPDSEALDIIMGGGEA